MLNFIQLTWVLWRLSLVRSLSQQSSEVSNRAKWNESMFNCLEFHQRLTSDFFGAEEFIASRWAAAGKSEIFRFLISELGEMQKFGETALKYLFPTNVSQCTLKFLKDTLQQ